MVVDPAALQHPSRTWAAYSKHSRRSHRVVLPTLQPTNIPLISLMCTLPTQAHWGGKLSSGEDRDSEKAVEVPWFDHKGLIATRSRRLPISA